MTRSEIHYALNLSYEYAKSRSFAGPDPYDGLAAPLARGLRGKLARQMWVQGVKRAGPLTRQALGVPQFRMAKSLALFSEGLYLTGREDEARSLAEDLVTAGDGGPWGYEFDVQTRWAFYPAGTPNVIATAFSVRSLIQQGMESLISSRTLEWLYTLTDEAGYLHYTPESDRLIHNGNLLAAETIARLGGDRQVVQRALDISLRAQRSDGSWSYGEGPGLEWVDNFHTVYVLESLQALAEYGFEVTDALSKGLQYWRKQLFDGDMRPLYFSSSTQPSGDIHNIATVVGALAVLPGDQFARSTDHPALRLLLSMQQADGSFRSKLTAPAFMRWNQAHAFRALARWSEIS